MITEMVGTSECTGCGGCYQICPRNAIEMKPDRRDFYTTSTQRKM